jgi:hypothetical protein
MSSAATAVVNLGRVDVKSPSKRLRSSKTSLRATRQWVFYRLETLVSSQETAAVLRERRSLAHGLVFGTKPL